jgi:hypothetical protein
MDYEKRVIERTGEDGDVLWDKDKVGSEYQIQNERFSDPSTYNGDASAYSQTPYNGARRRF